MVHFNGAFWRSRLHKSSTLPSTALVLFGNNFPLSMNLACLAPVVSGPRVWRSVRACCQLAGVGGLRSRLRILTEKGYCGFQDMKVNKSAAASTRERGDVLWHFLTCHFWEQEHRAQLLKRHSQKPHGLFSALQLLSGAVE